MNPIFSRTFKALCAIAVAGVLTACGSSSTVDPFKPTRVIALGDGYNDPTYTVTGTTDVALTVAQQVAVLFGLPVSSVTSYAEGDALITTPNSVHADLTAAASLTTQIGTAITSAGGGFSSGDLIVISIGTRDIISGVTATSAAAALKTQVERLLNANARHVLIMQPLELTKTPYVRGNSSRTTSYTGKTVEFINYVDSALHDLVSHGGYATNPVIYGGTFLSSDFNLYTSNTTASDFSTSTQNPACTLALTTDVLGGCLVGAANTSYATMLFADDINLTPAGNRWVAQRMYNATAQGWR